MATTLVVMVEYKNERRTFAILAAQQNRQSKEAAISALIEIGRGGVEDLHFKTSMRNKTHHGGADGSDSFDSFIPTYL